MRKNIILAIVLGVTSLISVSIFISMLNYAITFKEWYSFLTLKEAIMFVVISGIILLLSLIFMIINIVKAYKKGK